MAWIKRNLLFVVGLAVAIALIGGGVFYLLAQMDRSTTAISELEDKNKKLDELYQNDPFPEKKNIELAKAEQIKLQKFLNEASTRYQTNEPPKGLDSQAFQSLLLGTIAELTRMAEEAGTKLPATDYAFTFSPQKGNSQIPQGRLAEFAGQVADIRTISQVLFRAKVPALSSLKRAGASTNDYGNADIITGKKPLTDSLTGALLRPYEVQFQCFSSELGAVLAGFANATDTIVVRAVNIQKGTLATPEAASQPVAAPAIGSAGSFRGMDPTLARRYGLMGGRMPIPATAAPTVAAPTTPAKPGEPVVEEKPIQVTIALDVIKLGAAGAAPAGKSPAAPARKPAAEAN